MDYLEMPKFENVFLIILFRSWLCVEKEKKAWDLKDFLNFTAVTS